MKGERGILVGVMVVCALVAFSQFDKLSQGSALAVFAFTGSLLLFLGCGIWLLVSRRRERDGG